MNLVILGGGISGLIAAYAFRSHRPTLIEASPTLGGSYLRGGLKYIRATPNFESMLDSLHVPWLPYQPRGGLLRTIQGVPILLDHPLALKQMPVPERLSIQKAHWSRTRGTTFGFADTCMNDPLGEGDAIALHVDHQLLINRLVSEVSAHCHVIAGVNVKQVEPEWVVTDVGTFPYKRLITTLHMGIVNRLAPWMGLPKPESRDLSVAFFTSRPEVLPRKADNMDYVYTPDLPVVHRISRNRGSNGATIWQAEATGDVSETEIAEAVGGQPHKRVKLAGHLIPFGSEPQYPKNVVPLGRFAEWDTRSEAEKTLDRALALVGEWS